MSPRARTSAQSSGTRPATRRRRAEDGTCAQSSRAEGGKCGYPSRQPGPGAGLARGRAESRAADLRCPTSRDPRVDPRYPVQVTIRATPGLPSLALAACLRSAPSRHHAGFVRSLPGDPLLDPAGPRALHRRGGRGPPRPRRRTRARHPPGARRQPRPRPQGAGRRRPVSRPTAHDAAADANQHGLCAAQLPEAPARPRGHRSAELGSAFLGVASRPGGHAMSRRPRPFRRLGWRASDGGARAGRCGWKNTRLPRRDRTRLDPADVAPAVHPRDGRRRLAGCDES